MVHGRYRNGLPQCVSRVDDPRLFRASSAVAANFELMGRVDRVALSVVTRSSRSSGGRSHVRRNLYLGDCIWVPPARRPSPSRHTPTASPTLVIAALCNQSASQSSSSDFRAWHRFSLLDFENRAAV
ncbi:hypothetical protein DOTSEDRAFT_70356 [Dothistroma septosporum NZE10]|uniref:Uncharacterized protein n=1 Tax=Dothistroma septosporum (strain NZE10 / CBS 128990) TaxID=675120 RepID=N1PSH3_DOTSN|nr:hypothetical protein DOTSEDRAFT_70356 [Dothistroma septosporum NZE10]